MMVSSSGRAAWSTIVRTVFVAMILPAALLCGAEPAPVKSPLSPEESLKHFQLAPGLKIELVAAEPEVIDPVSIAFDENGTLWAVEMTDYPNGPQPGQPPLSRITALQDRDGDGRYETSKVFADKLLFATGIQPWKGGVIVTMAGEVAWFHDSDGDGVADIRNTWFKGFAVDNPQLRANHPRWGLDNRIYIANGLRGGVVKADAANWGRDLPPVPLNGFDFRFDPTTGEAEPISGVGQFGLTFDDYGHRFVCSNRNPCRQIILEDHYLKLNPLLAVKDVGADAVPSGADSHVFPISRAWTTSTQHAGQFTAACGVTIYRGSALPSEFYGNSFTCEPTGNLVHREVFKESKEVRITSRIDPSDGEFLASRDEWFRPVDLANGPDGALYVVDMYRAVIEHPDWVPDELKHRPDERDGSDRGRIYRIVPIEVKPSPPRTTFPKVMSTALLVDKLTSTDSWQAETAARLLVERMANDTRTQLLELAKSSESPLARWRAYRLLPTFAVSVDDLKTALVDASPLVRALGVSLVEPQLASHPETLKRVLELAGDRDPRVRFQVALSLGVLPNSPEARKAIVEMIGRIGPNDDWMHHAVLIGIGRNPYKFLEQWKESWGDDEPYDPTFFATAPVLHDVANLVGAQPDTALAKSALTIIMQTEPRVQTAGFLGLCRGIQRRGKSAKAMIADFANQDRGLSEKLKAFYHGIKVHDLAQLNDLAQNPDGLDYLSVLEFSTGDRADEEYLESLSGLPEQAISIKAIDILASYESERIAPNLLKLYDTSTPAARRAILRALLRSSPRIKLLFQAIKDKQVSLVELDPNQVKALTNHPDMEIRQQAQQILAAAIPQERKLVLEQFQRALSLEAKPERGRVVFEKSCATCHQIGKLGVVVGPDIADSRTKTPAQLLVDILSPNQAIDNNYVSYTVVTKDGRVETGFIANETASSITLKQPENKTQLILRQDVEELKSNGISLMPEGLEKNISVEQMADLISFIKNWRYLDGQVPGKGTTAP